MSLRSHFSSIIAVSLLTFFQASVVAKAADCVDCKSDTQNNDLITTLPTQVSVQECENTRAADDIKKIEDSLPKLKQVSRSYGKKNKIHLQGTEKEHLLLKDLLGQRTTKNEIHKIESCDTVLCALSKLYKSETVARYALATFIKTGYTIEVGWAYRDWNVYEAKGLYDALSMLPSSFYHLKTLHVYNKPKVYHLKWFASGDATSVRKRIRIRDNSAITDVLPLFHSTIVHETAHHYDYTYKPAFDDIGWKHTKLKLGPVSRFFKKRKKEVGSGSSYAENNPFEDFAETIQLYVFKNQELKNLAEEKYDFVKQNVFHGKVYYTPNFRNEHYSVYRSTHDPVGDMMSKCLAEGNKIAESSHSWSIIGSIYTKSGVFNYQTLENHSSCFSEAIKEETKRIKNSYYSCNSDLSASMNYEIDQATRGVQGVANTIIENGMCSEEVKKICESQVDHHQECIIRECLRQKPELQFESFDEKNQNTIVHILTQKLTSYIH